MQDEFYSAQYFMKKRLVWALTIILVITSVFANMALPTSAGAANEYLSENLITNGDFSLGTKFWSDTENSNEISVSIVENDMSTPFDGKPYAKIEIKGGYPSFNNHRPGAYPAGKYRASFWMKRDDSQVTPYNLQAMCASNGTDGYWNENHGNEVRNAISTEWKYFEYDSVTTVANGNVNFSMQTDNKPGIIYLADVKIRRVLDSEPTAKPVPAVATIPPQKDGVNRDKKFLYVFAGQSNMVGLNTTPAGEANINPRITKLNLNNYSEWLPGVENINSASATSSGSTSPACSVANEIIKQMPANGEIGLVGCASAGTSLAQWQKDSTDLFDSATGKKNLYNRMLERIKEAQKVGVLKGVFWHQGEADSGNGNYEQELSGLIDQLRADTGVPDLPFIMGQVGTNGGTNDRVNNALEFIKYNKANTNVATSEGMVLADNVHYTAESQVIYGQRYAAAYLALKPDLSVPEETMVPTPAATTTPNVTTTPTATSAPTTTQTPDVTLIPATTVAPTTHSAATSTPGISSTPDVSNPTGNPAENTPFVSQMPVNTERPVVKLSNKVKKIVFVKKTVKLKAGKKATLRVKLAPAKLTKSAKKVSWGMDKKGKKAVRFIKKLTKLKGKQTAAIKALKKGSATVFCKAPSGKKAVCRVSVR